MIDYVLLAQTFRHCAEKRECASCPMYVKERKCPDFEVRTLAADAIEELQSERDMFLKAMTDEHNRAAKLLWEKNHQWISVEDRLPELGQGVLVYDDCGYMSVADYTHDKHFPTVYEFHVNGEYEPGVTHWMPLPEPPKGVE